MQLLTRRPKIEDLSPAQKTEAAAAALFIKCDTDATALIRIYNFSWRQLEKWVAERHQFGSDFVRSGGLTRLKKAIQVLKEGDVDYVLYDHPQRMIQEDHQRWLVVMMLAKAAGVIEVSTINGQHLDEQFTGSGVIPFPTGRFIDVKGAGYNPDPETSPLSRKTIIFTERKS